MTGFAGREWRNQKTSGKGIQSKNKMYEIAAGKIDLILHNSIRKQSKS
ncbi:hypothetical protein [Methanolapillus ohkumae]